MIADPYETNNLYDSALDEHTTAKETLYGYLPGFVDKSTELTSSMRGNQVAFQTWKDHSDFIVPWVKASDLDKSKGGFPEDCYAESEEVDANEEVLLTNFVEEDESTASEASAAATPATGVTAPKSDYLSTNLDTSGGSGTGTAKKSSKKSVRGSGHTA